METQNTPTKTVVQNCIEFASSDEGRFGGTSAAIGKVIHRAVLRGFSSSRPVIEPME